MKSIRLLLLGIVFSSCAFVAEVSADDWSLFGIRRERGSGDIATEQRDLGEFERIRLDCSADLVVTLDSQYRIKVTTDDNLLDNVITEVIGRRTLLIDVEGNISTRRGIQIEIFTPHLTQLEVDGSGSIQIEGLKEDVFEVMLDGSGDIEFSGEIKELEIDLDGSGRITVLDLVSEEVKIELGGSGDIEMHGKAKYLECTLSGSGEIDARRLEAENVDARTYGSGDISVYASKAFDGVIYGSGDIDVYGNPQDFDRSTSGSGDIRRRR